MPYSLWIFNLIGGGGTDLQMMGTKSMFFVFLLGWVGGSFENIDNCRSSLILLDIQC